MTSLCERLMVAVSIIGIGVLLLTAPEWGEAIDQWGIEAEAQEIADRHMHVYECIREQMETRVVSHD